MLLCSFALLVQAQEWSAETRELSDCCLQDKLCEDEIIGVFKIEKEIGELNFLMYMDTELGVVSKCPTASIRGKYRKNSFKINDNPPVSFEKILTCSESYIPQRLFYIKNEDSQFVVVEFFHFMHNSINGRSFGYAYLFIRLDKEGELKGLSAEEFRRPRYSESSLITLLEHSFYKKE